MSLNLISVLFCCFLFFLNFYSSESAITRFEFITQPNDGEQEITDNADNPGPTQLPSFDATIVDTPADFIFMDQNQTQPVLIQPVANIADPDVGFTVNPVPLMEGITFLYPFARNPAGGNTPWFLGPLTIDGALPLLFKVDQGPPRAPQIGGFIIDGARTQNLIDPNIKAHYVDLSPSNTEFTLEVVFNANDIQNASSLEVSFIGTVVNNTALFDADPGTDPNPNPVQGAVDRKEALADVVAQLGQILSGVPDTGPPLAVSVISDVTTKTGPFPLDAALIDTTNQSQPNVLPAKSGPGLGLFNPMGFDFKTVGFDGTFEIIVGARDAFLNISPGGFNAFNNLTNPQPGTPTRILVIRDTASPQDFLLQDPQSVFIFGNTPPAVDPPFEDSIWSIKGSVNDERGDLVQIRVFAQDSPDKDNQVDSSNGLPSGFTLTADPNTGNVQSIIDATSWSPNPSVSSFGQVAYRFGFAPQDLHGNINVANNTELLAIKDFVAPSQPVFTNVTNGDVIKDSIFTIKAEADNDELSSDAEHGRMEFELSVTLLTPQGSVDLFSVSPPASTSNLLPVTNSLLDDEFKAFTRTIQIVDRDGQLTGQSESIVFEDRTSAFNNMVYDKFFLEQAINFQNVPDGLIELKLSLRDQAGNQSAETSVILTKDSSGPTISFNLSESGPDDNYSDDFPLLPNFLGSDDNELRVSLKSPEFTEDGGGTPDTPPVDPDPHFKIPQIFGPDGIALKIRGVSEDSFGITTRIDISSARIPTFSITKNASIVTFDYGGIKVPINQVPLTPSRTTPFEIRIPVFNLREGVQEVIRIEAVDNNGNKGEAFNVTVIRDVLVPEPPVIENPRILQGFTGPMLYTNKDVMTLSGVSEPDARLVALLPPFGNKVPGYNITSSQRISRTSPESIPISQSQYDSLTGSSSPFATFACDNLDSTKLTCYTTNADSEGRFQFNDIGISMIASSPLTPTTIFVQAIDASDNTDPVSSVSAITVHRNTETVDIDYLHISEYPSKGSTNFVEILPDSLNAMPGLTVFYGIDFVRFQLGTRFPMLEAPDLELGQAGSVFRPAGKISSVFSAQIGTFSFDYVYDVVPKISDFDGRVYAKISGGKDFFGNPVEPPQSNPIAFVVDTVAPNQFSTKPVIVLSPTNSMLITTFVSARIDLTDFFKDQSSLDDTSGVTTATPGLSIELFGPLQETPDSLNSIKLSTFVPSESNFEIAGKLQSPLVTDGTYRLEFLAVDNVGNRVRHSRTFFLDRAQIVTPLLKSSPARSAFINTMPSSLQYGLHNVMIIEDLTADMNRSDFELFGPTGSLLSTTIATKSEQTVIRSLLTTSIPKTDGSSDGVYSLVMDVYDRAGNRTQKTHNYIYDSIPPLISLTYPADGQCLSMLNTVKLQAAENLIFTTDVSGLDRQRSQIALRLIEPQSPYNTFSSGKIINSTVTYLSSDSHLYGTQSIVLNISEGYKGLPQGGEFDGIYELHGQVFDRSGNGVSSITSFFFDSRSPTLSISGFGDFDYLTNNTFEFTGTIQDSGACGLISSGASQYLTSQLSLTIYEYDLDTGQIGQNIGGPFHPKSIDRINPSSYPYDSSQGSFVISGSFPGGYGSGLFRFSFFDRAGNQGYLDRKVLLIDTLPPFPKRNYPKTVEEFAGEQLQTYVTSPLQILNWSAIPEASSYRLHLSRESVTPGVRTTFIDLPNYVTNYSVDFSLVNSVPGTVPLTGRDQFYWLVESIDGIGQGSDPFGVAGRGEQLEFDQEALELNSDQLRLVVAGSELALDSVGAFATGTSIVFKWYLPEPTRIFGNENVYVKFDRDNSELILESLSENPIETDQLSLTFPMPNRQLNGMATLFLEGFRDRAGNAFGGLRSVFKVDNGPEIQLKIFQNPVDPASFGFAFKGRDFQGLDDVLRYDTEIPTPQAFISEGFRDLEELALIPIRETTIDQKTFANAFTGSFYVSRQFVGDVRLKFFAEDFRGFRSQEDLVVHVLASKNSVNGAILKLGGFGDSFNYRLLDSEVDRVQPLVALSRKYVDLPFVPKATPPSRRLTLSQFPHFFGASNVLLNYSSSIELGGHCKRSLFMEFGEGVRPLASQKLICSDEGSLEYEIETSAPSKVFLMQDLMAPEFQWQTPPELEVEDQEIIVQGKDDLSGVKRVWLKVGSKEYGLNQLEDNTYNVKLNLAPGEWDLSLGASDLVGNITNRAMSVNILRPLEFDRCFLAPNPVIRDHQAFLNCDLSRLPEEVVLTFYDTAGKRIRRWFGDPEIKIRESVDLVNNDGIDLPNGVYFLKLRVRASNLWIKRTFKLAVIRP